MNFQFNHVKITGILTVVPENESFFDSEINNYEFSKDDSLKLKSTFGYNRHRISEEGTTITDYVCHGFNKLLGCSV